METLTFRQRQEWRAESDPRWVRTGCNSMWDAIFVAFREYRETTPEKQEQFIASTTKIPMTMDTTTFLKRLPKYIYQDDVDVDDDNRLIFCKLLSKRLFLAEMEPYLQEFIASHDNDLDMLKEEIVDKCILICNYRYEKKKQSWGVEIEDMDLLVKDVLGEVFEDMNRHTYDDLQTACKNMEYHVIILSPTEDVLFDSWTWKGGIPDSEYNDVIIILAHPDGRYDSVGRVSMIKDGNQKISRLFRYDDEAVYLLRKTI